MSLTFNSRKNRFLSNDGLKGFRITNNYKNTNETNDGLAGFRLSDNYKGDNRPPITSRDILATDGTNGDELGFSVAIHGNRAVAGAPLKQVGSNTGQGAVYLYDVQTETLIKKITATDGASGDSFGYCVGINNDYIVIGAQFKQVCYLYRSSDGTFFSELGGNGGVDSVAINKNNRVIVGSYGWPSGANKGTAYVYDVVNNNLVLVSQLTAPDGVTGDNFGLSVAISDNYAVVGAPHKSNGGYAYLYNISSTPTLVTELTASDGNAFYSFGYSVAISDDFVIVGTRYENDIGNGSVYIYNTSGILLTELTAFDGVINDCFGYSVSISGNNLLVGTPQTNGDVGIAIGKVYIYNLSTNPPTFVKKIFQNSYPAPEFGFSVAIDDSNGIAGFPDDHGNSNDIGGFSFIKNI